MKNVNLVLVILVVLVSGLAFGAVPDYEIIDLGTLGGSSSYPYDINDAGQVVGTSAGADGAGSGFVWDEVNGMMDMTELLEDSLDYDRIVPAIAINNNGQIVCRGRRSYIPPLSRDDLVHMMMEPYLLWDSESGFVELTAFENRGRFIMGESIGGINDNMQIIGRDPENYHALVWDSINGETDLGTLGGSNSQANDINESGVVVGASLTGVLYENGGREVHGFAWDSDNGMVDVGTLNNHDSSAWGINNIGNVVGASVVYMPDVRSRPINHAFFWSETEGMIDIHESSYLSSIAFGINDADQIVGVVSESIFIDHLSGMILFLKTTCPLSECPRYSSAFLWDERYGMVDLNELLGEGSGWDYLISAEGINNEGQIIGYGVTDDGEKHGFLMSPVPVIAAEVEIKPGIVNLSGRGRWVTCRVRLEEGYDVGDVDVESLLLEGEVAAEHVRVDEEGQVLMVRFGRGAVHGVLEVGEVELAVSGMLIDGMKFEGADTIRVIDRGGRKRAPKINFRGISKLILVLQRDMTISPAVYMSEFY